MSAPRRVAVTGATGMLGGHLARSFAERGAEVRALVRRPDAWGGSWVPRAGGAERAPRVFRFDLRGELDERGLEGVEALVHCAATTRSSEVAGAEGVDLSGARRLFAAARAHGVARIVFPSSTSARADAPSAYGRAKHAIEALLEPERDVALRLGLVLSRDAGGLFERMARTVARSRVVPLLGGGRQTVQPVHVDDVCRAVHAALERDVSGVLTVADPTGLELRALLAGVARRTNRRVLFVPVPYGPVLALLRAVEALRLRSPITSENVLGLREQAFHACADDLARLGLEDLDAERALDRVLGEARPS